MLNLVYTCVQILHNFGAVAVVGSPAAAWWLARDNPSAQGWLAWLLIIGWAAQGASGAGFGMTSYLLKGQLPDVAGVALVALATKVGCVLSGFVIAACYLKTGSRWSPLSRLRMWQGMLALAGTALSAAAFLRWFL
jgi:hypothetical protein